MWENTLIESKGFCRVTKRWWTVPAAAGVHAALITAAIVASYWHVEAMEAPPSKVIIWDAIPIQISAPPKLGGGKTNQRKQSEKKLAVKIVQPTDVPPLTVGSSIPADLPGEDSGAEADAPPGEGLPEGLDDGWGSTPLNPYGNVFSDEKPQEIVTGVTPPVLIQRVEPVYPPMLARLRQQGTVVLEAVITKGGDIEQIRTLRADHPHFQKAAIDAVIQWKYKPALVQGKPIKVYFTVTVIFRMR